MLGAAFGTEKHDAHLLTQNRHFQLGSVTMTTAISTNGATTLSRTNFSGYIGHVTTFLVE